MAMYSQPQGHSVVSGGRSNTQPEELPLTRESFQCTRFIESFSTNFPESVASTRRKGSTCVTSADFNDWLGTNTMARNNKWLNIRSFYCICFIYKRDAERFGRIVPLTPVWPRASACCCSPSWRPFPGRGIPHTAFESVPSTKAGKICVLKQINT